MAVFARADARIPLGPEVQHTGELASLPASASGRPG
jgi:hypothetical protein